MRTGRAAAESADFEEERRTLGCDLSAHVAQLHQRRREGNVQQGNRPGAMALRSRCTTMYDVDQVTAYQHHYYHKIS